MSVVTKKIILLSYILKEMFFFSYFSEVTFDCETTDGPFYPEEKPFEISNADQAQIETETSTDTTVSQGKDDVTRGQIMTQFSDISTLWRTDTRPPCVNKVFFLFI